MGQMPRTSRQLGLRVHHQITQIQETITGCRRAEL
jgi:hypothetical protein